MMVLDWLYEKNKMGGFLGTIAIISTIIIIINIQS